MKRRQIGLLVVAGIAILAMIAWWSQNIENNVETKRETTAQIISQPKQITAIANDSAKSEEPPLVSPLGSLLNAEPGKANDVDTALVQECEKRTIAYLTVRDDADSLLTAAMLAAALSASKQHTLEWHDAQVLLDRSIALQPNDPAIRALAAAICQLVKGCDPTEHERVLQRIDPKNALGWLGQFSRQKISVTDQRSDQPASDNSEAAWRAIVSAERLDLYWMEYLARLTRVLAAVPIAPPKGIDSCAKTVVEENIGVLAAMPLPALAPLMQRCKEPAAMPHLDECRAMSKAFRNGDTAIMESIGMKIALNIAAPGSAEERQANEESRRLKWQQRKASEVMVGRIEDWVRISREQHREMDAYRALIRENGISIEPPADWAP